MALSRLIFAAIFAVFAAGKHEFFYFAQIVEKTFFGSKNDERLDRYSLYFF